MSCGMVRNLVNITLCNWERILCFCKLIYSLSLVHSHPFLSLCAILAGTSSKPPSEE